MFSQKNIQHTETYFLHFSFNSFKLNSANMDQRILIITRVELWYTTEYLNYGAIPGFVETMTPLQKEHFAHDTSKGIFLNVNLFILIHIWLEFIPKGPTDNKLALVQVMACHQTGNKLLTKPMMTLATHAICCHWATMS